MKTKWFYTRDEVGKFTGKLTLMKKISNHIKMKLLFLAKVCIIAWMIVGGIKVYEYKAPIKTVYADREVVKEVRVKAPVMDRIKACESGGKHFDPKTGQVRTVSNDNGTVDIGLYQINQHYWGKTATGMGLNLMVEADNEKFAYWLYETKGTEPWVWSRGCWNK